MTRGARGWLVLPVASLAAATAFAIACSSFDPAPEASPSADGAAADAPDPPDGGAGTDETGAARDAGPCAKTVLGWTETFPEAGTVQPPWEMTTGGGGNVLVGPEPRGGGGIALRAFGSVDSGGFTTAYGSRGIPVRPRWIDLTYRIFVPPSGFYAELGCDVVLAGSSKAATVIGLQHFTSRVFQLGWARYSEDGAELGGDRKAFLMTVQDPERWYEVHARIEMGGDGGNQAYAAMTITDTVKDVSETQTEADLLVTSPVDRVDLDCGLYFADSSTGIVSVSVDDVSLAVCPE